MGEEVSLAVISDGDIVDSAVNDMVCDPSMFVNRGECEGDGYSGCTFITTLPPQFFAESTCFGRFRRDIGVPRYRVVGWARLSCLAISCG